MNAEQARRVTRIVNIKDVLVELTGRTPKSPQVRMLKLTNEVGELAQAIDIATGGAGTKYRNVTDPTSDILEESVDVTLVIASMIIQLMEDHNVTFEQLMDVFDAKLTKWARVLELDDDEDDQ